MLIRLQEKAIRALRWSEQYTKTDMVYLTSGGFWLSVGQGFSTLSSLILAIAFANLLPPETFGTYKYVISMASLLSIATLTGLDRALTQAIARGLEGSYIPGLKMRLRWGVLGSLGGLMLAGYYFVQGNVTLAFAFAVASPFIPLVETFGMYSTFFNGRKMFRESSLYFIVTRVVYVAAILLAVTLTENLLILLAAYFVPLTCIQLILFLRSLKKYPPNTEEEPGTLHHGVHLSLNGVVSQIVLYIDNILLFHYLGPIGVATYTFSTAPIRQIRASYKNLSNLALPKLSARSAHSIHALLVERLWKLFGVGLLIAMVYIIAAPFIFRLIFPEYLDSVLYSQLLAALLAFELPLTLLGTVVQSRLNIMPHWWLYWGNVGSLLFIASAMVLTPIYGILGIIGSRLISILSSAVLNGIQWRLLLAREKAGAH